MICSHSVQSDALLDKLLWCEARDAALLVIDIHSVLSLQSIKLLLFSKTVQESCQISVLLVGCVGASQLGWSQNGNKRCYIRK